MDKITLDNAAQLREVARVRHGWITQVVWSPTGTALAVAHGQGVSIYPMPLGSLPPQFLPHSAPVKSIAFHPHKPIIATASAETVVRLWSGSEMPLELHGHHDAVTCVAFSSDGQCLASGSTDKTVRLWDIVTRKEQFTFAMHTDEVTSIAFFGDELLITSGKDNTVYLLSKNQIGEPMFHNDWVRQVMFSPDGKYIASASKDMRVCLWSMESAETHYEIHAHLNGVDSLTFTSDSRLLATGGRDNVIRLWDVGRLIKSGSLQMLEAVCTLEAHNKPVLTVAFHPESYFLVSGSGDNTVRLWSIL